MRTFTINLLAFLFAGASFAQGFAQGIIVNHEYPEELPLNFYANWVVAPNPGPLDYFSYWAKNEEEMERILKDELTQKDEPLNRLHGVNPEDEHERLSLVGDGSLPFLMFIDNIHEDKKDFDSAMYIPKMSESRMRIEGWKKMPKEFYPGVVSLRERALRIYEETGKYIVFAHRNRDEDFANSGNFREWIEQGPAVAMNALIAKDVKEALNTPPDKQTQEMFTDLYQFAYTRFSHQQGSERFYLVMKKEEDGEMKELLLVHVPNHIDGDGTAHLKAIFFKSVEDGKWYMVPNEAYEELTLYLADESRLNELIRFR
jgi:hypothetical protein